MYVQFTLGGKTYHSHTTLISEDKQQVVKDTYAGETPFVRGVTFLTFYGLVEAVNRVPQLASLDFNRRFAAVAVPVLAMTQLSSWLYWGSNNSTVQNAFEGAPVWRNKFDVPELDKLYFFLDDDKNYEPSLQHHSVTKLVRPTNYLRNGNVE